MAQIIFDDQKLNKARYDVHNPLDAARFQRNVMEFIDLIRNTVVGGKLSDESNNNNRHLVNEFCRFVDDKKVWHLAQMVIPKFRSSLVKQDHDYNNQTGEFVLLNNILSKLSFLPSPRDDENLLTTEGDMVWQRHKRYVEYLVTRGKGRNNMTPNERAELDQDIQEVKAAVARASMQHQSPTVDVQSDEAEGEEAVGKTRAQEENSKAGKEKGKGKGKGKRKSKR